MLEEYKLSYNFGMSFSSMRVTAFSVSVAIIGAEASFATFAASRGLETSVLASLLLMVTAAISTNILVALNRGTFLFMVYCRGIEKRLGIAGFPTTYLNYVGKQHSNTGIFAFWLAALLLNIAAFGCVVVLIWWPLGPKSVNDSWLAPGTSFVASGLLAWMLYSLLRHRPQNYLKELGKIFEREQDEALRERGIDLSDDGDAAGAVPR